MMKKHTLLKIVVILILISAISVTIQTVLIPLATRKQNPLDPTASIAETPREQPPDAQGPSPAGPDSIKPLNTEKPEAPIEPEERENHDETNETNEPEDQEEPDAPPGLPPFQPYPVEETAPDIMLATTAIMADGEITETYSFNEPTDFGYGENYSWIEGITSFRGNNFRDAPAFGNADVQNALFGEKWSIPTGAYNTPEAYWSGHGWTGQPLIVKWPKQTRQIMNMHSWAQEKEELIEVVYAAMDGYVYFAELETGEATRDKLYLGYTFKGSGALDPRGYPLLYVGAGYAGTRGGPRILIVSLIDGSVLHTFGSGDSFAPRGWSAADASPLVDAENDRLIYPSENGVLYIIKLNSIFDPENGVMTIDPSETVKWRYTTGRSQRGGGWLGIESSPTIWRGHVFLSDNGGHLICLDLNTLEPVWVQDVLDDTNTTPVLELEDDHPYIYISTSFHGGWRAPMDSSAPVPMWKIDAVTGEIIWRTDYNCYTESGVSGGVQATASVGKNALSDLVYIPFARTPNRISGILAAFDKNTGEIVWEFQTALYSWSSPVCVYDNDGNGYIVYCDAAGYMYLLDGLTGEMLDSVLLGGVIEASPAVYNNMIVVGTRAMKIWGVELT